MRPRDVAAGPVVEAALKYAGRGWSVTPTDGKRPVLKDWPTRRLGKGDIKSTFRPEHNVGVVLRASGLADIDFDDAVAIEAYRALNPPELAETAEFEHAGRPHAIVQADGVETRRFKRANGSVLLELRGDGAQTVFPPSVHPDGERYVWERDVDPCRVESRRLRVVAAMIATVAYASEFWVEGSRHDIGLALAGFLARRLTADDVLAVVQAVAAVAVDSEFADRVEAVASTVRRVNDGDPVTGLPTLDAIAPDLARALASWWGPAGEARQQGDRDDRRQSQADVLVDIGKAGELFHDPTGSAFAAWQIGKHREVWPVRSTRFKNWLRREHHRRFEKAPTSDAVNAACGVLEGIALFDGDERRLHNRVAWLEGAIFYDLGDRSWRAVRVDREGWAVIDQPPMLFRRYAHQAPQVEPLAGGGVRSVLSFLNVREEDELLLMVWLVTAFVPDIPHPVPDFHGEKGAGKSVGQRVLRRLIDPSTIESLSFPGDVRELVQQLSHHYAPVYDNVDSLPPSVSDILCRAVTGEGFSKRELYSDDEDIIYSYRRVIMLNGVNVAPRRPDLLDRSMLIGLERIPRHKRREEREFWEQFERARPRILGGIFDALSAAMRIYPKLQIRQLERMADFTGWGAAVAEALGCGAEAFLRAYSSNVGVQAREAVESHSVGAALLSLMDGLSDWSGSPTDLLEALAEAGEAARLFGRSSRGKVDAKGWPGAPHILSRRLNEIRSNLSDLGIEICEGRADERSITIRRKDGGRESSDGSVSSVGTSSAEPYSVDATVAADAIFPLLEFKRWELGEPCYACGRVAWRQRPDGGWVCDVCHPSAGLMVALGRDGGQP